jgi:hypothetical protein
MTVPEGHYHAKITGGVRQEFVFDIRANYFDRWSDHPVWVINVGNSAILLKQTVHYSKSPRAGSASIYFDQPVFYFPDVTHPFETLPPSILMKPSEERTLTGLELFRGGANEAFYYLENSKRRTEAARLAEWRLRQQPTDSEMLNAYTSSAATDPEMDRIKRFLRGGLTNRPIAIEWHRAYQNLLLGHPDGEKLIAEYDAFLKAEPENSALLYLRGRICGDHALSARYFERAHQADQNNPYPMFALAYDQMAVGNWQSARPMLDQVVKLSPNEKLFFAQWVMDCLALKDFAPAENELRQRLKKDPVDLAVFLELAEVLVAEGKATEAQTDLNEFIKNCRSRYGAGGDQLMEIARYNVLYSTRAFGQMEGLARHDKSAAGDNALFISLLEQNRFDEAVKIYSLNDQRTRDPFHFLAVALAARLNGKPEEAAKWQARAVEILRHAGSDSSRTADLLEKKMPPSQAAYDQVILPPQAKALLFANLTFIYPDKIGELAAAARLMNVDGQFPHHLIHRAAMQFARSE